MSGHGNHQSTGCQGKLAEGTLGLFSIPNATLPFALCPIRDDNGLVVALHHRLALVYSDAEGQY
jgi:hypothetical protein